MLEVNSEIQGKSYDDGSNITVALKTYLDDTNNLIYKIMVVKDFSLIYESKDFKVKHNALINYEKIKKEYGI